MDRRSQDSRTDQPVCLGSSLIEGILFCQHAENIRDGFVQRTALVLVDQSGSVLRDTMCQFMPDNVESLGETPSSEYDAVAITENHLTAVPESVVVFVLEMDGADEIHAKVVDRIPPENVVVEIEGRFESIVTLIDR